MNDFFYSNCDQCKKSVLADKLISSDDGRVLCEKCSKIKENK